MTLASDAAVPHVSVIAGPYWAFRPLPLSSRRFASGQPPVELVPVPDAWSERACAGSDSDLDDIARLVREHAAPNVVPVLVLPTLARDFADAAGEVPRHKSAFDVLRSLTAALGGCSFDVRLVLVDGLDTARARADAEVELDSLRARVASSVQIVSTGVTAVGPGHPAFWRASLNRLTSMGPARAEQVRGLLETVPSEHLESGWSDPDARRIYELAPGGHISGAQASKAPVVLTDEAAAARSESAERLQRMFARGVARRPGVPRQRVALQPRKIAFVCEKMAARSGGAERVLSEVADGMSRRGYQVDILSYEGRKEPPFYPLELGVVHINLSAQQNSASASTRERIARKGLSAFQVWEPPSPANRIIFNARYRGFVKSLARYVDAARPDVVVPFMPPAIVAAALAPTAHRPRLVASMHNAPEQDFENPDRWDPGDYARRRRLELMARMDAITVLLPQYVDWYDTILRSRLTVVPNAVEPIPQEVLGTARRTPTILSVGRIADTKRHDLTLRAFAAVADEFPEWRVKIFGVGPMTDAITALRDDLGLRGRVEIPGHTAAIGAEYLGASILCHPARFEGFPLAVTESLASGLPVVGFADCSGVNALVVDGENGLLVDPGDGSDAARLGGLTNALRTMMRDEELRTGLGKAGPESMRPYAPDRVLDMWENVLFPDETRGRDR